MHLNRCVKQQPQFVLHGFLIEVVQNNRRVWLLHQHHRTLMIKTELCIMAVQKSQSVHELSLKHKIHGSLRYIPVNVP